MDPLMMKKCLWIVACASVLLAAPGCILNGDDDNGGDDTGWVGPSEDTGPDGSDTVADSGLPPGDTDPRPDTPDGGTDDTSAIDTSTATPQTLEVPKSIELSWPGVGNTARTELELRNAGERPLTVSDLQIQESGDSKKELTFANTLPSQMTILPDKSTSVTVEYQPLNETTDSATVTVAADDPSLSNGTAEIPVDIASPSADIEVPGSVLFTAVPKGETDHKSFEVLNTGKSPLEIDDMTLNGDTGFKVSFFDPDNPGDPSNDTKKRDNLWPSSELPESLDPGASLGIRIWFTAPDTSSHEGTLEIRSNDPDQPTASVKLQADAGAACLGLSHQQSIDFGPTSTSQGGTKTVTMENCRPRGGDLEIDKVEITDDGGGVFALDQSSLPGNLAQGQTFTISGDDRANFVVTFSPNAKNTYTGELTIESNDPSRRTHKIQLEGEGTDNACPNAEAEARIKGAGTWSSSVQASPNKTIAFDGTDSSDSDGSIQRYEWSIIARPQNSTARLTPSASVKAPELFLDIAGTYKVELVVYDNDGSASCGSRAVVTVDASPDEDVFMEVVWDTPADPDPTDSNGADVDIHYRHADGSNSAWNKAPWDVFWHNKNPDWGAQNDPTDDPEMTVEDGDGAGPEIIVHDNPKSGTTYRVAVYYYDDNGFGPSHATVRIYHQGKLRMEHKNKYLPSTFTFWNVAKFTGQPNSVTKVDTKQSGFP